MMGADGEQLAVTVTFTNTGGVAVAGLAPLAISLTGIATGDGAYVVATKPLLIKLAAGQSRTFSVLVNPGGYDLGLYVVASLQVGAIGDPIAADGIAVSATPIGLSNMDARSR